jgi:hypothetical protein
MLIGLAACGGSDSVTIRGDVEGLDSLALRGDSLVAEINRAPDVVDSLMAASQAEFKRQLSESLAVIDAAATGDTAGGRPAGPTATGGKPGPSAGGLMSQRAQARGDSMARAFAARLAGETGADRARRDTLRGVLVWQGAEPVRTVILRTAQGPFDLSGMATTGLGRLVGSEVVVRGVRVSPRSMAMVDFFVRAADGVPAFDGIIQADGSLRLSDGTGVKRVPLPDALQGLTGARIWVAVKAGQPQSFGLIQIR